MGTRFLFKTKFLFYWYFINILSNRNSFSHLIKKFIWPYFTNYPWPTYGVFVFFYQLTEWNSATKKISWHFMSTRFLFKTKFSILLIFYWYFIKKKFIQSFSQLIKTFLCYLLPIIHEGVKSMELCQWKKNSIMFFFLDHFDSLFAIMIWIPNSKQVHVLFKKDYPIKRK